MRQLSKEQFKRKWVDTHTELSALDLLEQGRKGSLLVKHNEDKSIKMRGKIPGKNIIEKKSIENQEKNLKEFILDASMVRSSEILDMDYAKLLSIAVKLVPTQVENRGTVNFTFGDMVRKANISLEKVDTIEDGELVDEQSDNNS